MSENQSEFERLSRAGDEHYGRKEYSIASECYRIALEKRPGGQDLLFNFAYSLAATNNDTDAAIIYQQAIQAGSGAAAHNNLGLCYRKLGKNEDARHAFVSATKLERSNARYWRNLAACLADLKEPNAVLHALEILSECNGCTASDWNKIGCARESEGNIEGGLAAFRNAASASPKEYTYFFNIALMHERSGRILDAFHACRHSLTLMSGYESAVKMMLRLKKALKPLPSPPPLPSKQYKFNCPHCGNQISSHESVAETRVNCSSCSTSFTSPRLKKKLLEIGPHDYVNPYTLLNLNVVRSLPGGDEWFERPKDWSELLGSLTRRRRALQAEMELNEGSISWLPQLSVTAEVIYRALSDLDDSGWHPHHWAIFRLPLLNRFLMHGEVEYFYSLEEPPYPLVAGIAGTAPDDFEHEEFIAFLSPFFRERLATAIKQALDLRNHLGASMLFGTIPPLIAADLDEALEPIRRYVSTRQEVLKQFKDAVNGDGDAYLDAQLQSAFGDAKLLNALPANLGEKLRDDMCYAYRNIAIALVNHRNDFKTSEQVLKVAESFMVSITTKQLLADDRAAIARLQAREQERKQHEEQLSLRLPLRSWLRERILTTTPDRFTWGEESMATEQMNGVRYGITITYSNGVKTGSISILALSASDGATICTTWLDDENFHDVVRSVMGLYAFSIITKILSVIEEGDCRISPLQLSTNGIAFERGFIFTTRHLIPWADAETHVASGNVQIYSRSDPKTRIDIECRVYWNACLLPSLIGFMKSPK